MNSPEIIGNETEWPVNQIKASNSKLQNFYKRLVYACHHGNEDHIRAFLKVMTIKYGLSIKHFYLIIF